MISGRSQTSLQESQSSPNAPRLEVGKSDEIQDREIIQKVLGYEIFWTLNQSQQVLSDMVVQTKEATDQRSH